MNDIKRRLRKARYLPRYIETEESLAKEAKTPMAVKKHKEAAEKGRKEYRAILRYIGSIKDEWTRGAFILHYIEGKTWKRVAMLMEQTPDSVRMMCNRYMEKHSSEL